ncbi:hypothetical protein [Nonomuraea sp. 10N515B]|uniref:hypothetical protein n=1 Tax=Nonomuraea sp. 10N515B TaxID=3457422 RepID=UPI003FCD05F2
MLDGLYEIEWESLEHNYGRTCRVGDQWRARSGCALLQEIVLPLGEGRMLPVRRAAVRYLGKTGPRAASVVPILHRALATDRRLSHESGWRAVHGDEEFRDEIRHTVDRIGRSATEEETRYA